MNYDLNAVRYLLQVIEHNSFTLAAQAMGISQPGISKAVDRLEKQVGVKLLYRSTRNIKLTEDGALFIERIRPLIQGLEEAHQELKASKVSPVGTLRVSAPSAFGRRVLIPIIRNILDQHKQLDIDLVLTDRKVSVFDEGFDAVIRSGKIADERLVAHRLKDVEWVTLGSAEYLAKNGVPMTPDELGRFNCLKVRPSNSKQPIAWRFCYQGKPYTVSDISGNLILDHGDPLVESAIHGIGLVQVLTFFVRDQIRTGQLQEILADYKPPSQPLHLMYPPSRQRSAKLTVLREALEQSWGKYEGETHRREN